MMTQVVQIVGAVLVLAGFVAVQMRRLSPDSATYLWLNLAGSAILATLALLDRQWGFLMLNGTWFVIGAWCLITLKRS